MPAADNTHFATLGVLCPDGSAVQRLEAILGPLHAERRGPARRIICHPCGRAVVAVALLAGSASPAKWASRPDGSFCVLDGSVFDIDAGAAKGQSAEAAHLLSAVRGGGAETLAALHSEASAFIWDAGGGRLTLLRDRTGVVPLYHAEIGGALFWSTHMASLLAAGAPVDADLDAFDCFLGNGFIPAPLSPLRAVRKLPAAHALTVRPGSAPEIRRFEVPAAGEKITVAAGDQKAMLKDAICSAVRRRIGASSGRTGVLLSGGIDSSLLAAQAAALSEKPVASFTFSYGEYEGLLNEDPRASKVAAHLAIEHSRIEVLAQRLRWIRPLIGMIGGAVLPILARVPGAAARRLHKLAEITVTEIPIDYRNAMTPLGMRRALYADPGRAAAGDRGTRDLFGRAMAPFAGRPLLDRWLPAEDAFSGDGLTFCPLRWARSGGASIRFPFRDRAFVDTMLRFPRRSGDKRALRRVGMDYMPRDLANVPKVFQAVPIGQWFRGPLAEFLQDRLSPARLRGSALFDGPAVESLLKSHLRGHGVHTWTLWGILVLLAWQDVVNQMARFSIADAMGGSFD